jgi:hypothetical protein
MTALPRPGLVMTDVGSLADRWVRKTTYLLGAVLMLVSIIPGSP